MKKFYMMAGVLFILIMMMGCSSMFSESLDSSTEDQSIGLSSRALVGSDVVGNLTSPTVAGETGSIDITFEYNASETRDIRVSIKNKTDWSTLVESIFQVNGSGSKTEILSFDSIPSGADYTVEVKMFETGSWTVLSEVSSDLVIKSAGFYISEGKLYDSNGYGFVMRGINHAHAWFNDKLDSSLSGIAATNANTVRVVLSNGEQWTKTPKTQIENIIQKCKDNKLVAVLEVHDTTGYGDADGHAANAATLQTAVDYWIEMKDALIGQEEYVIINIANEPFGNGSTVNNWQSEHISAIDQLRTAGFTHTLMVDAPNWGQDWQNTMRDNASTVFDSDSLKNTMFSVHMYEVYNTYDQVNNYISTFVNNEIPLVIGEFAAEHKGKEVKEKDIMERCQSLGVGYLGWSWDGNASQYGAIDIINDWNSNSLTEWGEILINDTNGIKATSWKSSMY